MGVVIFAPLLLVLYEKPWLTWKKEQFLTLFLLTTAIVCISFLILYNYPVQFLMIPCVVISCFYLSTAGMMMAVVTIAIIEIWITLHGHGIFVIGLLNNSLLLLQFFIGIITLTGLVLCAVLEDRTNQAKELRKMMNAAETANQTKSDFLATMSHELRTPLNVIIGYSEMLEEDIQTMNPKETINIMQKIISSARNLLSLISGILDMSKIESGKMEIFLEPIKISDLIDELKLMMDALVKKNNNRFELKNAISSTSQLNILETDRSKLRQSLLNLLSNASKFSHNGTITLEAKPLLQADKKFIQFCVRDTGIGIPKELLGNLFQAFYQVDGSTTRKYDGTGLGLYLAHQFCEMLGGKIAVTSEEHKGSEFTITLPIAQDN
jgi:signal transduction histidine kinase